MATAISSAVRIVRATELRRSAAAGDTDAHRAGAPPPSYGLQDATGGRARAVAYNLPLDGAPIYQGLGALESGWHYHNCELQLAFITSGDIEVAYADGDWRRCRTGEILAITGQMPHNVGRASERYGLVELTMPGAFGTTICPPHPKGVPVAGLVLTDQQVRPCAAHGVAEYLTIPQVSRTAELRLVTGGDDVVETPPGGLTFTLTVAGRCDIEADGNHDWLSAFDMVIDDARRGRSRLFNRSSDFRAYQVKLREHSGHKD